MTACNGVIPKKSSLILDASVLINLHACGLGLEILDALPHPILATDIAADEITRCGIRSSGEERFLEEAYRSGRLEKIELNDQEFDTFTELIVNQPVLDDGEAATLAVAVHRGFHPAIDERKGRSRALSLLNGVQPAWSLDLILHPDIIDRLGRHAAIDALYGALSIGRMRICPDVADRVIALIGFERAKRCTCLPGYKARFGTINQPVRA